MKLCKEDKCLNKRFNSFSRCYKHIRAREKAKKLEKKERRERRRVQSKKYIEKSRKALHRKCWKLISEYIRRREANFQGMVQCYTCPKWMPWKEANTGHLFHGKLDFDERNLAVQCPACNLYLSGNLHLYSFRRIKEHGTEWMTTLMQDVAQDTGYDYAELQRIHADITEKLAKLYGNPPAS